MIDFDFVSTTVEIEENLCSDTIFLDMAVKIVKERKLLEKERIKEQKERERQERLRIREEKRKIKEQEEALRLEKRKLREAKREEGARKKQERLLEQKKLADYLDGVADQLLDILYDVNGSLKVSEVTKYLNVTLSVLQKVVKVLFYRGYDISVSEDNSTIRYCGEYIGEHRYYVGNDAPTQYRRPSFAPIAYIKTTFDNIMRNSASVNKKQISAVTDNLLTVSVEERLAYQEKQKIKDAQAVKVISIKEAIAQKRHSKNSAENHVRAVMEENRRRKFARQQQHFGNVKFV